MWHSHFNKLFAEVFCIEGQESLDLVDMVEMVEERFPGDKVSETSKYLM